MKKAPILDDESLRLEELQSYNILDTAPELAFDDITYLASQICSTPIALVSLIDSERQWFKSRYGLEATETPRDISFCGHAIHQDEVFEIQDSTKDERFSDNPLVLGGPKVIFYAGAPLTTRNGHNIGTLCVINSKPGKLTTEQKKSLKALSRQVVSQMELGKQNKQLVEALNKIENQQIQISENAKMASLGRLAGGVAHEINNPLAIISGKLEQVKTLLQSNKLDSNDILPYLETLSDSSSRIAKIIKGMLDFSRDEKSVRRTKGEVKTILQSALNFMEEKCRSQAVTFYQNLEDDLIINVNQIQISQIVLNLLNNSFDAVQEVQNKNIALRAFQRGHNVIISVTDNGIGIPSEKLTKIMEPFFTTKPVGKGTGLGLSISKSLARANGGDLEVSSKEGQGTEFSLILPQSSF